MSNPQVHGSALGPRRQGRGRSPISSNANVPSCSEQKRSPMEQLVKCSPLHPPWFYSEKNTPSIKAEGHTAPKKHSSP